MRALDVAARENAGERVNVAGPAEPLLRTAQLTKRFGGLVAIERLDLTIGRGEVCGIIGPNGAGKSTLVGLLGGALRPTSGTIEFAGSNVTARPAAERARAGIGRTYQIPRPFLDMTVRENVFVSLFSVAPYVGRREAWRRSDEVLERTGLADVAARNARELQLLRRKRLELARALALRPRLLLLDEIGAGLIESEITELIALVRSLADEIDAIVIVEHVMRIVRECCRRLVVLNFGKQFADGPTAQILAGEDVAAVYLGTHDAAASGARVISAPGAATEPPPTAPAAALDRVVGRSASDAASGEPRILSLRRICAGYGQTRVLHDVDLDVRAGSSVAILGTNGAGKTTLARTIAGTVRPTSGRRTIGGIDASDFSAHRIAGLGIAHCMEGRRVFAPLSVEENLSVAARGVTPAVRRERLAVIYALFPVLAERRNQPGTAMSGGQQQMLAIGRALMARPSLVILDEVSLGLAPVIVERLYDALRVLRAAGLTMLVVEQNVDRALDLADEVHVLEQGRVALSGSPASVRADPRLRHLYVGEPDDAAAPATPTALLPERSIT